MKTTMKSTEGIKMKKSWKEVSINDYWKIKDIIESDLSATERDIAILAVLCGVEEDVVWSMKIDEVKRMLEKTAWVNDFKLEEKTPKTLMINGKKFIVTVDLTKFTVAQYVDFQTFWKKQPRRQYIGNILACFLVPEGKEYADGYDIQKLAQDLCDYMDIMTCQELLSFFMRSCLISIQATLICLDYMKRKEKRKKTANLQKIKKLEQLKTAILDGFPGSAVSPMSNE